MFTMIAVFTPVMKVQICCCFYPRRSEGILFSLLIWLISFCAENVCVTVFSKLWKIFGRLVHVHLENNGVAHLISNTWLLKKILSNCKWCIPLKKGNPATRKTVRFVALINYYAVNFCYWKYFYYVDPNSTISPWIW